MVQKAGTKRSQGEEEKSMPALPSKGYKTPMDLFFASSYRNLCAPRLASARSRSHSVETTARR